MQKRFKKIAAIMCAITIGTSSVLSTPLIAKAQVVESTPELAREAAAEGCVLLENDNNTLPYAEGTKVSVFGRAQLNYYRAGVGSGGGVKTPYDTTILEGMQANPKLEINQDLVKIYEQFVKDNPDQSGGSWGNTAWCQEEIDYNADGYKTIVDDARKVSDAAVIIISRTAGEDREAANAEGSYLLTDREETMIEKVTSQFDNVTVVLNTAHIMDMKWVDQYGVEAVLYAWQGGMTGGDAVADILTGDVNPSGHLTDTIAVDYEDYPSANNFGGTTYNNYQEDIYVGYRYFETFAKDDVAYPFGCGLSYTTFDMKKDSVTTGNDKIHVSVTVKNTGEIAGKQVVQVYYGAPVGKLGNPEKELAAFAKTKLLQPGESQKMTLSFNISDMASYDDAGKTGYDSAYVLEAGDYKIYLGDNVRSSVEIYTYKQEQLKVTEQLSEQMAPVEEFDRMVNTGSGKVEYEKVPTAKTDMLAKANENTPGKITQTGNQGHKLIDVYNSKVSLDDFVAQFSDEQLAMIVVGESAVNNGASTMGATTDEFENTYGFPFITLHDGPSGIKYNKETTCVPNGTALACTWNPELVEKVYQLVSEELDVNNIDNLLGPGLNIHRNPLTGRNFEYQSEDPLVTGVMGGAVIKGIQYTGASATPKHFVANNQENARRDTDSRVSERALREIYLKGFEIAVKTSSPHTIMTAYNAINGNWAASNSDMVTNILREEWGWEGMVMTDWWCQMNKTIGTTNRDRASKYLSSMIKAQTDIYMIISGYTVDGVRYTNDVTNGFLDGGPSEVIDIPARLQDGYLKTSELQRSVKNICNYMMKTAAFADANNIEFKPVRGKLSNWFDVVVNVDAQPTSFYTLEAEAGMITGSAKTSASAEASNGYLVGDVQGNDKGVITFNVNATDTERRTMKIYYATAMDRKVGVTVNNGHLVTKDCASNGSWGKPGEPISVNIALRDGVNTIEIAGDGDNYAANIDRIELEMTDAEAAGVVMDWIDSLSDNVTEADKAFVFAIKQLYESLTDKIAVTNIAKLKTALEVFNETVVVPQYFWMEGEIATLGSSAKLVNAVESVNGYFVGDMGGPGNGTATFKIKAEEAGTRILKIYYCSDEGRSFGVQVNGGDVVEVACPDSNSWTTPAVEPVVITVDLQQGENTIVISGVNGKYAPNLDSLVVELTESEVVTAMNAVIASLETNTDEAVVCATQVMYERLENKEGIDIEALLEAIDAIPALSVEGEAAELANGASQVVSLENSNGYYVGNLGGGNDASATFHVQVAEAGMHTLKVYYMSDENRNLSIVVNDAAPIIKNCVSTGGWDKVATLPLTTRVELNAGHNTILLTGADGGYAPNIDRIEIALSDADAKKTVEEMIATLPETVTDADKAKVFAVKMAYEDLNDATDVAGAEELQSAVQALGGELEIPSAQPDKGDNDQTGENDDQTGGDNDQTEGDGDQTGDSDQTGGNGDQIGGDDDQTGGDNDQTGGDNDQTGGDNDQIGGNGDQNEGNDNQTGGDNDQTGGDNDQTGGNGDQNEGNDNQTGGNNDQTEENGDQTGEDGDQTGGNNDQTGGNDSQTGENNNQTGGNNDQTGGNNNQTGENSGKPEENSNQPQPEENDQTGDNSQSDNVVKVSSIKINGVSKKIAINKKIQLTATVAPQNATNAELQWSVDNSKYASVNQKGLVKVKKAGKNKTVTVKAEAKDGSGVVATYKIKIMPKAVKKIKLVAAKKTVKAGNRITIEAIINPIASSKKMNKTLKWTSSNTKYATVSQKGVVKTKKAGKNKQVKITARATDGSNKKAVITLKLK